MPMRSIVGDFPWETSLNHYIVVESPHIGHGQGAPGGVGTQVHSDVPFSENGCHIPINDRCRIGNVFRSRSKRICNLFFRCWFSTFSHGY